MIYNENMNFKLKKLENVINVQEIANVHFFQFPKGYQTSTDKHPFLEMVFVGTGSISIRSKEYNGTLNKNELLIHPANCEHSLSCPKRAETTLIIIGFTCVSDKLEYFAKKPVRLDESQVKQLAEIVQEGRNVFAPPYNVPVYDMIKKKHTVFGSEQMLRSLIEGFLIGLIRKYEFFENSDSAQDSAFTINEIVQYIDNNYTEKIKLEELENPDIDTSKLNVTAWMHDLFRPSHHPYDPEEIKIIREFTELADREELRKKSTIMGG